MSGPPRLGPPPWARSQGEVLTIKDDAHGFGYWLERPYVSAELREQLVQANVLIVPVERFRQHEGPLFTTGTEELFHFLRAQSPGGVVVDICIEDNDYQEYSLHDATIEIAHLVIGSLVLPLVVHVLWRFIEKRLTKGRGTVKAELTVVEPDGQASTLRYDGPAEEFNQALQKLGSGERPRPPALPSKPRSKKESRRRR